MKPALDLRSARIAVELTDRCNLRCAMCPMDRLARPSADMPWDLAVKIAADFRALGLSVEWLHEMGEPLLYARLAEAIDLFGGCSVSTNATLLDGERTREILASSLGRIRLCIDTVDPAVYPLVRRGGNFEAVVANIRGFLEAARGRPIRVEIQRLVSKRTGHESRRDFEAFFALHRFLNATVVEKTCSGLDTSAATDLHESYRGCFVGYPFSWFVVLSDGRVTHCCYDSDGVQAIGDLRTQSVTEVAESDEVRRLAAAFAIRDWASLPRCGECHSFSVEATPLADRALGAGARLERWAPAFVSARKWIPESWRVRADGWIRRGASR